MTYQSSVQLKIPVLKYINMQMIQRYIKSFKIEMMNKTAVSTESSKKLIGLLAPQTKY